MRLNDTIQDACIRRARMQGRPTRWVLGTDHAGIATQTKVDKALADEGICRLEIGREAFVEACYDWYTRVRRHHREPDLGHGLLLRLRQTSTSRMEPAYVRAVRQVFCRLVPCSGLVYRGKRIVNWCPHCTTAIADDEAEYVDEAGAPVVPALPADRAGRTAWSTWWWPPRAPRRCWATRAWP